MISWYNRNEDGKLIQTFVIDGYHLPKGTATMYLVEQGMYWDKAERTLAEAKEQQQPLLASY